MTEAPFNILFVCSLNKWRSRTAETLYARHPLINARSAGTSRQARRRVTLADVRWADLILVMEEKHRERLRAEFRQDLRSCELLVLAVEDRFPYMDPRLIEELQAVIDPILESEGIDQ